MPNGPCETVALPEENAARLSLAAARHVPLRAELGVRLRGGELSAPRGLRLSSGGARPLGLGSPVRMKVGRACTGRTPRTWRSASASPCRPARSSCPSSACVEEGGRQATQVPAERTGRQNLEAAQGLPLSERRQLKTAGSVLREGGEAHSERHLRPLLHEPQQVQEHKRLRGPSQVRAGRGPELRDELRASDQRLRGVPGLRGDAQDGLQQGLRERAHPSRRSYAAALQAHDGEGLLPPEGSLRPVLVHPEAV